MKVPRISRHWLLRALLWGGALILVFWTLQKVSLLESWEVIQQLGVSQILMLVGANGLVLLGLSGRWWFLLGRLGHPLPYRWPALYRLAGFGISYYTPGPQFGGEPLQVHLIQRRHGVPGSTAITSLSLDKALELVVNFGFLAAGTVVLLQHGILSPELGRRVLPLVWILLALPVTYLTAIWCGRCPLSAVLMTLLRGSCRNSQRDPQEHWIETVVRSEQQLTQFCRCQTLAVLLAFLISVVSWVSLVGEFWLALHLLRVPVTFTQAIASLVAARIAMLFPFPGGLGALEVSQVWMLTTLGFSSASGLGFVAVNRARDLVLATVGLGLGWYLAKH